MTIFRIPSIRNSGDLFLDFEVPNELCIERVLIKDISEYVHRKNQPHLSIRFRFKWEMPANPNARRSIVDYLYRLAGHLAHVQIHSIKKPLFLF